MGNPRQLGMLGAFFAGGCLLLHQGQTSPFLEIYLRLRCLSVKITKIGGSDNSQDQGICGVDSEDSIRKRLRKGNT